MCVALMAARIVVTYSKRQMSCLQCHLFQRRNTGCFSRSVSAALTVKAALIVSNMQLNGNSVMQCYSGKFCMNSPFNYH